MYLSARRYLRGGGCAGTWRGVCIWPAAIEGRDVTECVVRGVSRWGIGGELIEELRWLEIFCLLLPDVRMCVCMYVCMYVRSMYGDMHLHARNEPLQQPRRPKATRSGSARPRGLHPPSRTCTLCYRQGGCAIPPMHHPTSSVPIRPSVPRPHPHPPPPHRHHRHPAHRQTPAGSLAPSTTTPTVSVSAPRSANPIPPPFHHRVPGFG